MDEKIYLSKEKLEEIKEELLYLSGEKRNEIIKAIEHAKSLGDLSENAEYHDAREEQGKNEDSIRKLENMIANAAISSSNKDDSIVDIGETVTLLNLDNKKKIVYTIVAQEEADFSLGKISYKSPIGSALIGRKIDDVFTINIPSGDLTFKILSIK